MHSEISEKEHQLLLDAIKDHAIFMMDTQGRISSWNEGALRLKGFEEEDVIGQHFRMLFQPEDQRAGKPEAELQKALAGGRYEEEWWRMRKDGSRFWAHIILQPIYDDYRKHIGFAKITSDITAYKRINELNNFLMNELSGYAIFLLDKAGTIAQWSRAAENIVGFTGAEVLGRSLALLQVPRAGTDPEEEAARHLQVAAAGRYEEEAWMLRRNGTHFWANYIMTPLHNGDGFVVMIRDLTDQRAYEQQQKNNKLRAASTEQLERFAFVASHDLKEPVRKIPVFCHMLKSENGRQDLLLDKIIKACRRTGALLDDILELSQVTQQEPPALQDLDLLVSEVLTTLDEEIHAKGAVLWTEPLPQAPVIPSQFRQLMLHLVGNALKFSRPGGVAPEVWIEGHIVPKEALEAGLLDALLYADAYLQLRVRDNGIGFDPGQASNIFDAFIRLHGAEAYEGTGIGQSICKRVAENHGGHIEAFSAPGKGAEFVVTLPCPAATGPGAQVADR